jgi:hypothetical protein
LPGRKYKKPLEPTSPEGQELLARLAQRFSSVTALDLSSCYGGKRASPFFAKLFPALESIQLRDCSWVTETEVLSLATLNHLVHVDLRGCHSVSNAMLVKLVQLRPQLTSIAVGKGQIDAATIAAIAKCSRLTSVAFSPVYDLPQDAMMPLAVHGDTLTSIEMLGYRASEFGGDLFEHTPVLERIILPITRGAEPVDAMVRSIADHCPRIKVIDLFDAKVLDPSVVVQLITKAKQLTTVRLRGVVATLPIVTALAAVADRLVDVLLKFRSGGYPELVAAFPKWTAVHCDSVTWAVLNGHVDALKQLLAAGVDVEREQHVCTSLMLATRNGVPGSVEVCELLTFIPSSNRPLRRYLAACPQRVARRVCACPLPRPIDKHVATYAVAIRSAGTARGQRCRRQAHHRQWRVATCCRHLDGAYPRHAVAPCGRSRSALCLDRKRRPHTRHHRQTFS